MERMSLHDIFGDLVVYRNLEPADPRLPALKQFWPEIGLESYRIPRKAEVTYARAILYCLSRAQEVRGGPLPFQYLLYIGDTRYLDETTMNNLQQEGHLPVYGFVGTENLNQPPRIEVDRNIVQANRWPALADFVEFLRQREVMVGPETAVLVDMDKTAIGPRGRNGGAIDKARLDAVYATVKGLLGDEFRHEEFKAIYDELNQPLYHGFTEDNQDFLVYVCLMISAGLYDFAAFLKDLEQSRLGSFRQFVDLTGERLQGSGQRGLWQVYQEVQGNLERGDPTPFKSFRRREYVATVGRMNWLGDEVGLERILAEEITIAQEVADFSRCLQGQGALLFIISDKPDEASVPEAELAAQGYRPLHRVRMRVVGEAIYDRL